MAVSQFKAVALTSEINLNKIARHFGINRKFKWEDCLALSEVFLKGVLNKPENKLIYIYPFGSMVFMDCEHHEISDALRYLAEIDKNLSTVNNFEYTDDYKIEVSAEEQPAINNDYIIIPDEASYHRDIVITVLAKSVALERIENDINMLLDEIEDTITQLKKGHLLVSDEQLANTAARILGFKINTISSIMLLDKPDITWDNEEASNLFDELNSIFELNARYDIIKHKTDVLMDITTVFAELAHAKRGTRLEWVIIALLIVEIVLAVISIAADNIRHLL